MYSVMTSDVFITPIAIIIICWYTWLRESCMDPTLYPGASQLHNNCQILRMYHKPIACAWSYVFSSYRFTKTNNILRSLAHAQRHGVITLMYLCHWINTSNLFQNIGKLISFVVVVVYQFSTQTFTYLWLMW